MYEPVRNIEGRCMRCNAVMPKGLERCGECLIMDEVVDKARAKQFEWDVKALLDRYHEFDCVAKRAALRDETEVIVNHIIRNLRK